jgi:hypothetical protein
VLPEGAAPREVPRGTLREARERFERAFIGEVVRRHQGKMAAAAVELGIERTNLYRKMKQLGIKGRRFAGACCVDTARILDCKTQDPRCVGSRSLTTGITGRRIGRMPAMLRELPESLPAPGDK